MRFFVNNAVGKLTVKWKNTRQLLKADTTRCRQNAVTNNTIAGPAACDVGLTYVSLVVVFFSKSYGIRLAILCCDLFEPRTVLLHAYE